jgi:3-methyladenine DNA glycosylase AlkD
MTAKKLVKEIKNYCIANSDEALVKKYSRYFKEGLYDAYGVSTDKFREKLKEITTQKDFDIDMVFEAAPLLFKSGKYEEASFAIMMFYHFRNEFNEEHFGKLNEWFRSGINNWAHADTLGMQVLPWFTDNNIVSVDMFNTWMSSTYKFQRRTVPVTLIKSLKNSSSQKDFSKLLRFIEPLMTDEAREVQQGVGWFLREAWKRRPVETEKFLMKWKDRSPRLIFQYACEKMSKEGKEKFRKKG